MKYLMIGLFLGALVVGAMQMKTPAAFACDPPDCCAACGDKNP